jgi:hypothetical protein
MNQDIVDDGFGKKTIETKRSLNYPAIHPNQDVMGREL